MRSLTNKRVLLGVSGGIAAYKAADLCRRLRDAGAEVQVAMTPAATEFIRPLTLQALSGRPVRTELLDAAAESAMGHIELARWADLILVAPATADFLARLVQGLSNDLLTACCRAATVPIAVAPAMNQGMWLDPATQRNVARLRDDGVRVLGPGSGAQACGEVGEGRMLEPIELVDLCAAQFETGALAGLRVVVTAGPTYEDIDPVRFIGNRSSGRMGYAVASAAVEAGALVHLITGPVALSAPERVTLTAVRSAQQMLQAVEAVLDEADIFIGAAAVADYRPALALAQKIERTNQSLNLELVPNPDILLTVAKRAAAPFTVGFAAQTQDLAATARRKLETKGVDMIAANQVGEGLGFDMPDNALQVFWRDGQLTLPLASKPSLARDLIALIAERYHAERATENHRFASGQ